MGEGQVGARKVVRTSLRSVPEPTEGSPLEGNVGRVQGDHHARVAVRISPEGSANELRRRWRLSGLGWEGEALQQSLPGVVGGELVPP